VNKETAQVLVLTTFELDEYLLGVRRAGAAVTAAPASPTFLYPMSRPTHRMMYGQEFIVRTSQRLWRTDARA
jgi:hypothetical protein